MNEGFDIAAVIAAAISGVISVLSIMMSKRDDISLEKIRNDLEIKKDEQLIHTGQLAILPRMRVVLLSRTK
ncbi:MAG: hypothetical protein WAM14_25490 [Candidatus Nitrosopolaris sp.]